MLSTLDKIKQLSSYLDEIDTNFKRESFLLLNGLTDMVVVTDKDGIIKFANPASFRVLGYDPNDLVGESLDKLSYVTTDHKHLISDYIKNKKSEIVGIGRRVMAKDRNGHPVSVYLYVGEIIGDAEPMFLGVVHKV